MFRSTGSYEPDRRGFRNIVPVVLFRSTGSYEPDRGVLSGITTVAGFDPQALTSLTLYCWLTFHIGYCFDPQALTSLTRGFLLNVPHHAGFDPQALTSLTIDNDASEYREGVSIHRLLRA